VQTAVLAVEVQTAAQGELGHQVKATMVEHPLVGALAAAVLEE
jgi:hypothetical protein